MTSVFKAFLAAGFLIAALAPAQAQSDPRMADRVLGDPKAPVKVDEYVSLTCVHCADFYTNVLPVLEPKYVATGKVKFIMHDFPLDGISLKAAAVARCMPTDEYYPFIKTLYKTQMTWAYGTGNPETNLIQYARLGGLSEDKARACANDAKLQDAIISERTAAGDKYQIEATPTFLVNDGIETIKGAQGADTFSATFDRLLAANKK
jgi:protein-disulfide isomerase